jgi:GntR family transcriptional regulator
MQETPALSRDTGVPLYVQLRELLRSRIQAGEWGEDDALPTEDVLAAQFTVSRATVRQALTDLVRDGLIMRRAGLGTFPRRAQMILRMERFLSFSDDLRDRGLRPGSRLLDVSLTDLSQVPEAVAREFDASQLISISTLRLAADRPVVVFRHLFPAERFKFLLDERLDDPDLSFYELIVRKHGIRYARATGEIAAVEATPQEREFLELSDGAPSSLIELRTRTYDDDGMLMEYSRAVVRSDRYALTFSTDWRQEPR